MASCFARFEPATSALQQSLHKKRVGNSSTPAASIRGSPALKPTLSLPADSSLTSSVFGRALVVDGRSARGVVVRKPHVLRVEAAKRVSKEKSLVLSSTLIAEKGKEEEVSKLCQEVLAWGQERKLNKLGVIQFECSTDAFESNVFHFWERYETFVAMNDTRASPEHCKFMEDVRPLLSEPVALAAYEYNDGKIGCMLNPIGPKGEGGLDDATGQGGSGGGASYKQTSQSVMQGLSDREGWGLEKALQISQTKGVAAAAKEAQEAISQGLKNLFKKKD